MTRPSTAEVASRPTLPAALTLPARTGRRRLRRIGLLRDQATQPKRLRRLSESAMLVLLASAIAGTAVGGLTAGPVAAAAAGIYAPIIARAWRERQRRLAEDRALGEALDAVTMLAADLRAGSVPATALGASMPVISETVGYPSVHRVGTRLTAALHVADSLGAPLADVLDRLDGDLRATRRAHALARAQTAGAQATTLLLAALPAAGVALGYSIGADPLRVLLRTPLGAACLAAAITLHLAGLYWSERLRRSVAEAL